MLITFTRLEPPPPQSSSEPINFDFSDEPLFVAKREAFEQKAAGKTLEELRAGISSYDEVELSVQARNRLAGMEPLTIGDTSHLSPVEQMEMVETKLGLDAQEFYETATRFMHLQEQWIQNWQPDAPIKHYDQNGEFGRYFLKNLEALISDDPKMALLFKDHNFDFETYKWDK